MPLDNRAVGVRVRLSRLLFGAILVAIFALHAEEVVVSGRVVDDTRKPVAGIRIAVSLSAAPDAVESRSEAISDTSGQFVLRLAPGSYQLSADGDGFFAVRGQAL